MAYTLKQQIEQLYIAWFNRVPDNAGLDYWYTLVSNETLTLAQVNQSFADTPEAKAAYPSFLSNAQFVEEIFQNVLERSAEPEAVKWLSDLLDAGKIQRSEVITVVLGVANNNPGDQETLANKIAVADYTIQAALDGAEFSAAQLEDFVDGVTSDPATVVYAKQQVDAASATTVELTLGVDNILGTAHNDTISGITESNPTDSTFGPLDSVDGGAGVDTLDITNANDLAGMILPTSATVKNVEKVQLLNASGAVQANVNGYAGLESVAVDQRDAFGNVSIDSRSNVTAVSVKGGWFASITDNGGAAPLTADVLNSVSLQGMQVGASISSDSLAKLSVVGTNGTAVAGSVSVAAQAPRALDVTLVDFNNASLTDISASSITITSTGAKSTGVNLFTDGANALTVAGDKALSVSLFDTGGVPGTITTITSTNTAGLTVTNQLGANVAFTGGAGNDGVTVGVHTKAVAMGAGDDSVTMNSLLGVGGTLDGGEGTDTLGMSASNAAAASATTTFENTIAGFEKLSIGQVAQTAGNTVNLANLDDISYVISAGTAAGTPGTAEVQTYTFTTGTDADGGVFDFGGVTGPAPGSVSASSVVAGIAANQGAWIAANPTIAGMSASGNVLTVNYNAGTTGNVPFLTWAQNPSGATFGATVSVDGVNPTAEQQTVTVGTAPGSSGTFTVGGTPVTVSLGDDINTTATKIANALNGPGKPANVASAAAVAGVVTVTFTTGAGNAAALLVDNAVAVFGAANVPAVADDVVAFVAGTAETQTVVITNGTDANGGEVVVAGARLPVAGGLSADGLGIAIVSQQAAIIAANPGLASVNYNTLDDTLTFSFAPGAGNVAAISAVDNVTNGMAAPTAAEVTQGVAGISGGTLSVTNMASGGTLELTGAINGASSVGVVNAGTSTSDVLNIKLNGASNIVNTAALSVANVETINIATTDSNLQLDPMTSASTVSLVAPEATKITVAGNHGVNLLGSNLAKLTELDASGVVATGNYAVGLTAQQIAAAKESAGAVWFASQVTDKSITVKTGNGADWVAAWSITDPTKSATISTGDGADLAWGSIGADTVDLGAGSDVYFSSANMDTVTLGLGNDKYDLQSASHSVLTSANTGFDSITDFSANTYGNSTTVPGGAGTGATSDPTKINGDVIDLVGLLGGGVTGVDVGVFANAADAQTFIQNIGNNSASLTGVALDSSTSYLYLDTGSDGVIDSVIKLVGVTTITEAAFQVA